MLPKALSDKYHFLKLMHQGIGGEVFLVEHKALACRRVIKTVKKTHPQYGSLVQEAKLLQQFHHPSIPIIYDVIESDTAAYLIEEFIEGESLRQYFLRLKSLSDVLLLTYSKQLCELLHYIHNPAHRVLHLDLKPENILISDCQIKLIDFGSAICQKQGQPIGAFFGSPGFYAPEQAEAGHLSEQTDIYGLGRLLEYMLFHAKKSPKGFFDIVQNCLRKGKKLYTSAEQVKQEIERISHKKSEAAQAGSLFAVTGIPTDYHGTVLATALAAYFSKKGKRVLFLMCSRPSGQNSLKEDSIKEWEERHGFVWEQNGITIAEHVALQEVRGWRGRGYDCIICDLGTSTPLATGIAFTCWFCVGSMSEYTTRFWHQTLDDAPQKQQAALVLTEGDAKLAMREFGKTYVVAYLTLRMPLFYCSKENRRLLEKLLSVTQ